MNTHINSVTSVAFSLDESVCGILSLSFTGGVSVSENTGQPPAGIQTTVWSIVWQCSGLLCYLWVWAEGFTQKKNKGKSNLWCLLTIKNRGNDWLCSKNSLEWIQWLVISPKEQVSSVPESNKVKVNGSTSLSWWPTRLSTSLCQ